MVNENAVHRHGTFRRFVAFLLCAAFSVVAAAPALASDAAEPGVVRVGYFENEVFQEGAAPNAVKTGYAYEYYRKLSEYTGWKYEYVYGSFSDLYQNLLSGEIDLLAGLAMTGERASLIAYPDAPMGSEAYSLVKHNADKDATSDPASLSGKRIGVLDSAMVDVLNAWLHEKGVSAEVVTYNDYADLFNAFDQGGVDILAAEGDGAYGREHAEVLCSFGSSNYYLCVSQGRPDLLEQLNLAQAQLTVEEPNYMNTLRAKYYPVSVSSRAFSAAEAEWLQAHDELKIGYFDNYLPYSGTDGKGNPDGIVKDLIPTMLYGLGINKLTVSYRGYGSYEEMIAAVNRGEVDAVFPVGGGMYYSEENGIYQSGAVISMPHELICKEHCEANSAMTIAVNAKNKMQYYYVSTLFPNAIITEYSSIEDCLDAVVSGKADATTLNGIRAYAILRNSKYDSLSPQRLNRSDDRCFGVKIGNEGMLKLLNRGISMMNADYPLRLSNRYVEKLHSESLWNTLWSNGMGIFCIISVLEAAVIVFLLLRRKKKKG